MAMFLARIVMPRSRSRSFESRMQSPMQLAGAILRRFGGAWQSTSVVLPWSTWAMMAILRMSVRRMGKGSGFGGQDSRNTATGDHE